MKSPASIPTGPDKYLTIVLENECYALPVLAVREILRLGPVTHVPQMPPYVTGVINLRGRVIAVLDLRAQLGLRAARTDRTCIVVVELPGASGVPVWFSLVVDAVEEVITIAASEIAPPPAVGQAVEAEYLTGIAKVKGRATLLLDVPAIVGAESSPRMAAVAA